MKQLVDLFNGSGFRPGGWLLGLSCAFTAAAQPPVEEAPAQSPIDIIHVGDGFGDEKPIALETVTVQAQRVPPEPKTSTGLDGPTYTQPLSLVSLSRQEITDSGARDLTQAIENEAAASVPVPFQVQPVGDFMLRGFQATVLFDGFSSLALYGDRDSLAGIDHIDIVKGPGSALNSGALGLPPGGVIDIHSAWPGVRQEIATHYSVSRYGQHDVLAEADTGDLVPVLSLGIAAERGAGAGFFDFSTLNHQIVRPSMSLRGLGGRLSFYYEDSRRSEKDYPGLPTTGTLDTSKFSIPDNRSINDPDVPLSRSMVKAYGFDGELPLGSWLTLTAAARKSKSDASQVSEYISSDTPDTDPTGLVAPSTFNRMAGTYVENTTEQQARARLTARYGFEQAGKLTGWVGYSGEEAPDYVALQEGIATPLDVVNPTYGNYLGAPLPISEANSHFHIRNATGGLQWRLPDWFNVFGALTKTDGEVSNRQTSVISQSTGQLLGGQAESTIDGILFPILASGPLAETGLYVLRNDGYHLISRQFGAAFRLWSALSPVQDDGLWIFYGQGNGNQFYAYFTGAGQPKPELSNQREGGLRLVTSRWGKLETAAFRIQRRNAPTADPNSVTGFGEVTTGLQSVRGVDLESTLKVPYPVIDHLSLNGSAAWLNSRLDEDTTYMVGNKLPNVPRLNWRVQLSMELLRAPTPLRLFVARRCRTEVAGDLSNTFTVPGRCLSDAGVTAGWKGFTLDAVVRNLGDTHYYEPYTYLFYGVIPGERRTAQLTAAYAFGRSK